MGKRIGTVASVLAGLCTHGLAAATTLSLPEPGYLVIDGAYYGYGLRASPSAADRALLSSLDAEGFYFDSLVDLGNCQRANGAGLTPAGTGIAQFRTGDNATPPVEAGLAFLSPAPSGVAQVDLVACEAATVVLVRTGDGDTVCSGQIAFPLQRGTCAALDAHDPGFVYFDAFED